MSLGLRLRAIWFDAWVPLVAIQRVSADKAADIGYQLLNFCDIFLVVGETPWGVSEEVHELRSAGGKRARRRRCWQAADLGMAIEAKWQLRGSFGPVESAAVEASSHFHPLVPDASWADVAGDAQREQPVAQAVGGGAVPDDLGGLEHIGWE